MKKTLFFLLLSTLSFGQVLTKEENDLVSAIISRDLTKNEQQILDNYMSKKFVNAKTFLADTEVVVKKMLYVPIEDEAECAGILIASAKRDGYSLANKTYEDIWDAAGNYCREYLYPEREAKKLSDYYHTKFTTLTNFRAETYVLQSSKILKIDDDEIECAEQYIKNIFNEGDDPTQKTYEEIINKGKSICEEKKIEEEKKRLLEAEKTPVMTKGYNEGYQYLEVQFTKTKKGFNILPANIKQIEGTHVETDISAELQRQIEKDFANDKPGNYTAFYDVSYVNDLLKRIKLKARLNR